MKAQENIEILDFTLSSIIYWNLIFIEDKSKVMIG